MDLLQMLLLVVITGLLGALVGVAIQVRDELKRSGQLLEKIAEQKNGTPHGNVGLTNFGVWTYRSDRWQLSERRTEPGFVVGDPPRRPGAYEGETVRKPAVRGM